MSVGAVTDLIFSYRLLSTFLLLLESQCKGMDAPSIRSLMVDEERMRSGHWLRLVLCVLLSALMLMGGWQEEHSAYKTSLFR